MPKFGGFFHGLARNEGSGCRFAAGRPEDVPTPSLRNNQPHTGTTKREEPFDLPLRKKPDELNKAGGRINPYQFA